MGCDIHAYREKKIKGVWETGDVWKVEYNENDVPFEQRFTQRNYDLFGVLASVRRDTTVAMTPRGIPVDACELVRGIIERWGPDGHSHSFIHLHELKMLLAYLKTGKFQILIGEEKPVSMGLLGDGAMEQPKELSTQLTGEILSPIKGMMDAEQWDKFCQSSPRDYDLIYPYCQFTTKDGYVNFEVNVPLYHSVGEALESMVKSLEELDGEDQRIVFFFDN